MAELGGNMVKDLDSMKKTLEGEGGSNNEPQKDLNAGDKKDVPLDKKDNLNYLQKAIGNFKIKSASPGMSDLMVRLYRIRIGCGITTDEETMKLKLEQEKGKLKKVDEFEYEKCQIKDLLDQTRTWIHDRKDNPTDITLKKNVLKNIKILTEKVDHLKELQRNCSRGLKAWLKKRPPPELLEQRENDIKAIEQHIKQVTQANRRVALIGSDVEEPGVAEGVENPHFSTVDEMENMGELNEKELPQFDISEGLKQIEEKKKLQNQKLDIIDKNLDVISEMATDIGTELDNQSELLEKIGDDIEKHRSKLEILNKTLDKAYKMVGGSTKLICILIGLIFLAFLIGIGYIVLKFVLGSYAGINI